MANLIDFELINAQMVADRVRKAFENKGWCSLLLTKVKNEKIIVVRDSKVAGYPAFYPVYTDDELKMIHELSDKTNKLINHIKKHGAVVTAVREK